MKTFIAFSGGVESAEEMYSLQPGTIETPCGAFCHR